MSSAATELSLLQNADHIARVEETWEALSREFEFAYTSMPVKFMERSELTFHPYVKLLGYLALELSELKGDVVEIGVWKGRSLALMGRLCGAETKVIGIDPCAMPGQESELNYFKSQVFPDAELITEYSERAVATVIRATQKIKLLHIDGGHNAFNVWADFLLYERFVVRGGYIVFDDYADATHSPEVKTAIDEMRLRGLFGDFEVIGPVRDYENSYVLHRPDSDDVTAARRHRCAKVGLRGSTKEDGHVGDYHGRARPGEECVSGSRVQRLGASGASQEAAA